MVTALSPPSPLRLLLLFAGAAASPDFEVQKSDGGTPGAPAQIVSTVIEGAGEQPGAPPSGASPKPNAYMAVMSNAAQHFRAFGPLGGHPCGVRTKTSVTARAHHCRYATNAGPFSMATGKCDGGVYISDGKVLGSGGFGGMFGVTKDGHWVIGTLDNSTVDNLGVTYAVNAFSWLVRNGTSVVSQKGGEIAPRTTIGTTKDGKLLILEVDGCEPPTAAKSEFQQDQEEKPGMDSRRRALSARANTSGDCKYKLGRTLYDMAEMLVQHGAHHAINLDGGGSSTVFANNSVINRPTSTDVWSVSVERAVTVITCIV